MALPDQRNLKMYAGSTHRQRFDVVDDFDRPVVLTGFTARLQVRDEPGAPLLHEASTENGELIVSGPEGTVLLDVHGDTITEWEWDAAMYDLYVTSPSGRSFAIARGTVQVHPSITSV